MATPVHIPFLQGQDESWDKRLLPVGPMRAIQNAFFERTGRLVPRRAMADETQASEESGDLVGLVAPNIIIGTTNRERSVVQTVGPRKLLTTSSDGLVRRDGTPPVWQKSRLFYPDKDIGAGQDSSYVAFNLRGQFVRAYRVLPAEELSLFGVSQPYTSTQWVFQVCDEEMRPLFTYQSEYTDTLERNIKMIHSTVSNRAVVMVTNGNPLNPVQLHTFETVPPYTHTFYSFPTGAIPSGSEPWDISAVKGEDYYLFAGQLIGSSSGWLILQRFGVDYQNHVLLEKTDHNYGLGVSCCGAVDDYWMFGCGLDSTPENVVTAWRAQSKDTFQVGVSPAFPVFSNYDPSAAFYSPCVAIERTLEGNIIHFALTQQDISTYPDDERYQTSIVVVRGEVEETNYSGSWNVDFDQITISYESVNCAPLPMGTEAMYMAIPQHSFPDDTETEYEIGGVSHLISQGYSNSGVVLSQGSRRRLHRIPEPQRFGTKTVWPLFYRGGNKSLEDDGGRYGVAWAVLEEAESVGLKTREGEVLMPGAALSAFDGVNVFAAGYDAPPCLAFTQQVGGEGEGDLALGEYIIQAHLEWQDANGRRWTSAPSVPKTVDFESAPGRIEANFTIPWGMPNVGATCKLYVTRADGSLLRFSQEKSAFSGQPLNFEIRDQPTLRDPAPYTAGGVLPHEAPPQCSMVARTRSRVWAAGISGRPDCVQASMVIQPGQGIYWSNLDQFFVSLPGNVTGLAAVDDSVIAFTEDGVFVISGSGPNNQGVGGFEEPLSVPTTIGCINPLSVIVHETGVFFQSNRGIESVGRGAGAPEWVGEPVIDTLEQFPICLGAATSPLDNTIRWLFTNNIESRVVLFDLRVKAWMVYEDDASHIAGGPRMRLANNTISSSRVEQSSGEDASHRPLVATQSLRLAGMNGWVYGQNINVLGTYLGPCRVTLEFDFSDLPHEPRNTYTWALTDEHYTVGGPVQLDLTLPVMNFSAVNFRLSVEPPEDYTDGPLATFAAHGITVYFEPAPDGPRRAAFERG